MSELLDKETLRQLSEVVSAMIELEAIRAENRQREVEGNSPAYAEEYILDLLGKYNIGPGNIQNKFQNLMND
jgi:hypothetical protein